MNLTETQIAVLGLGASGEAAARLALAHGAVVTVLDSGDSLALQQRAEALRGSGIDVLLGRAAEECVRNFALTVISPGIDPATPLAQSFLARKSEMIGELELAWRFCLCPAVAITGTNGKTTTTELIEKMFLDCGVRTKACGNIGPAFSAHVSVSGELEVMTLEVSSFQLERITSFRPRISVWLNLTPDHLDRYASIEEYRAAKLRIFDFQTEDDFAVINLRDELPPLRAKKLTFSAFKTGGDFSFVNGVICFRGQPVLPITETNLRGVHNAENLMAALAVGFAWGLSFEQMTPALKAYRALPHRCELVRELAGVRYVNDSKATNLDALEKALESEQQPVVLIAGGKDKGFEFDSITALVARKAHDVVLIGEMSGRIFDFWNPRVPCVKASSLADSVMLARQRARSGDVVLFSPGTSSFDMFKNYADRGDQFRRLVENLNEP
jgi:UDP-N-acetylmuramoylalanine--D-glutamate ligase